MLFKSYKFFPASLILCFALVSCTENAIRTTSQELSNGRNFVSTSAANNMSVTSPGNAEHQKVCVRLGPDATFSETQGFSVSFGGESENTQSGENENEMVGRSIGVVAMRDVIYNLCLANMNGSISDEQYSKYLGRFIEKGFEILKIEAENEQIIISETNAVGAAPSSVSKVGATGTAKQSKSAAKENKNCPPEDSRGAYAWKNFEKKKGVFYDCTDMDKSSSKPKTLN